MEELIVELIRLLCPYLKKMAEKTKSPIDDIVVRVICSLVEKKEEGRK